ncbi:ferritin-like domain-containing protein [Mucilaginibacter robiniae]|uniref:Ferritin-like domain-containing protein n=1 Tax=Mucilaginibacter robiniae TaxID=2728022 RepID=A0A7L5E4H2_9SPHI|nr:ferritin-like domain-containing protein [Mucilaginibacter robiniae]QJD97941.1 ferritin-like domain-containing protein [Mucilaginibacter robiniae]
MKTTTQDNIVGGSMARRSFLKFAGAGAAAVGVVATAASCNKHGGVVSDPQVIDLGSGDLGILNYAYALEQLEAAFYTQVIASPFSGITAMETSYLTDIRDHEVAHREFFKAALGSNAIGSLTPNFSKINFADRTSVLAAAKGFEDLGVSAYNGAGAMIKTADYLVLAGKIVSVEARHAALIRALLGVYPVDDSIVTLSAGTSLEISQDPLTVLNVANAFVSGKPLYGGNVGK